MGDKIVNQFLKRKKLLGLTLLAIGALLYATGYEMSFDPSNLGFITFLFIVIGIIVIFVQIAKGRCI